jgi:imidazolonepropionase-like amidohydrolase
MPAPRLLTGATNGNVFIEGDRIVAVSDRSSFETPEGVERIDCSGATIVPGLFNAHVHFFERKWSQAHATPATELAAQLEDFTRYGFTSVFDLSSEWENTRALRERIERGEVAGPRIRSTGEGLVPPGALPPPMVMAVMGVMPTPLPEVADARAAAHAVRALLDHDPDAIKVFLSSNSGHVVMEREVLRAIVDEAHRAGKKVFVHPNTADDVRTALSAGVDVLAHTVPRGGPWTDDILQAARERRTALIPTLALWKRLMRHDRLSLAQSMVATAVEQLRAWREAGGIVLFGTDYGAVDADPSDEYALMQRAGVTTGEILASMTTAPAEFFGETDRGRIAPGYVADLAVVDPTDLAKVRMTIRNGEAIYRCA